MNKRIQVDINWRKGDLLADHIASLQEALDTIPGEYKSIAQLDIDHGADRYGDSYITYDCYYYRKETEHEIAKREFMEQHRIREKSAKELQCFYETAKKLGYKLEKE